MVPVSDALGRREGVDDRPGSDLDGRVLVFLCSALVLGHATPGSMRQRASLRVTLSLRLV